MNQDQRKEESVEAGMAQAFKDLAKGERAAAALEDRLTSVEQKINILLERAEHDEAAARAEPSLNGQSKDQSVGSSKS